MNEKLIIGIIILLFVGLAFIPNIHADISKNDKQINISTEICEIRNPEIKKFQTPFMLVSFFYVHINGTIDNISQRYNLFNKIIIGFHAKVTYLKGKTVFGTFELVPGRFWYEFWANIIVKEFAEIDDSLWYIDAIAIPFTCQTWPN